MVVFEDGLARRSEYRRFAIRTVGENGSDDVRSKFVKLLPLPFVERMIVTLGTANLHAEEDTGGLGGESRGVGLMKTNERRGRLIFDLARRGEDCADGLIPRGILVDAFGQPLLEQRVIEKRQLGWRHAVADHVGPVTRPVVTEFG